MEKKQYVKPEQAEMIEQIWNHCKANSWVKCDGGCGNNVSTMKGFKTCFECNTKKKEVSTPTSNFTNDF